MGNKVPYLNYPNGVIIVENTWTKRVAPCVFKKKKIIHALKSLFHPSNRTPSEQPVMLKMTQPKHSKESKTKVIWKVVSVYLGGGRSARSESKIKVCDLKKKRALASEIHNVSINHHIQHMFLIISLHIYIYMTYTHMAYIIYPYISKYTCLYPCILVKY